MSIDDVVNVSVSQSTSGLHLPGFGKALLCDVFTHWTDRIRTYSDPAGMKADGFSPTDQIYLDAVAFCSQNPRPPLFKIGRLLAPAAQVDTITVTASANGVYSVEILGQLASFTASGSTAGAIRDALVTALGTLIGTGVTAEATGPAAFTLTADDAGVPFVAALVSPGNALAHAVAAGNGVADDLSVINALDPDWRLLLLASRDDGTGIAAADAIEALPGRKTFIHQTAGITNVSVDYSAGTPYTDFLSHLKYANHARTMGCYHPDATQSLAAAWAGRCLPEVPAAITWKFKTLVGVTPVELTENQYQHLLDKNGNSYSNLAGVNMTFEGKTGSGEFLDIIRGIDKLQQDIQSNVFIRLASNKKVPYTREGMAVIGSGIRDALQQGEIDQLIAASRELPDGSIQTPAYSITLPDVSKIPIDSRATRGIPQGYGPTFEGTIAGAIHAVDISGTVSV